MIPERVTNYLQDHGVSFERRPHALAVSAQELAATLHVTGYRVAKSVMIDADGMRYICVLPATERLSIPELARSLGAQKVRLLTEQEFAPLFPDCEIGAEPPLGGLWGLPVVVDDTIAADERIVFRGGTHEETIEMRYRDFAAIEKPVFVGSIGVSEGVGARRPAEEQPTAGG